MTVVQCGDFVFKTIDACVSTSSKTHTHTQSATQSATQSVLCKLRTHSFI